MKDRKQASRQKQGRSHLRANDGMTLMIVPHSQKHVVKLHLNFRIINFALVLVAGLAFIAATSFVTITYFNNQKVLEEKQARGWLNKIWLFDEGQQKLEERVEFFKEKGEKVYSKIWTNNIENPGYEDRQKVTFSRYLKSSTRQLVLALDFLARREKAFRDLPLGWPIKGGFISSTYGSRTSSFGLFSEFHTGYDFAGGYRSPVYATADGVVIYSGGTEGGLGLHIKILHNHGFISVYGHCAELKVRKDQVVKRNQVIGLLGRTGNATGPHVHYEVKLQMNEERRNFELNLNPWPFVKEHI